MEFEDMQIIWNNQNEEKLYAINEAALHNQIRRKGKSITRKLDFVEMMMIFINLIASIFLGIDAVQDNQPLYAYILPGMYFVYALIGLARRLLRQQEEVHFESTLVGELDKALWQINYLIKQSRSMMVWYLLPLMLVAAITILINSGMGWTIGLIVIIVPLAYFGGNWKVNKFYLPKKRSLESLRETLLTPEPIVGDDNL
ncbi:MAG: hypothetical protein DWQ04_05785 [Chloroflexi bacterium]|nr:MAG: hypothetical protein DWQ04_05785 [Chloroflexota bacterium]